MSKKPEEPKTNVDKAVEYIAKHPGCRSQEIEEQCGIKFASATLSPLVEAGYLVACKVEKPGSPPTNEYRLSATVAADQVSWKEFRIAKKAGVPLTKAPARPPRIAAPTPAAPPPKAETPPAAPAKAAATKPPASETNPAETGTPTAPKPTVAAAFRKLGEIIAAKPSVVFMVDSTGQLRIEIPDHPPIVCSRDETRDAGRLLISTEPVWA